jgi:hypothetical protein
VDKEELLHFTFYSSGSVKLNRNSPSVVRIDSDMVHSDLSSYLSSQFPVIYLDPIVHHLVANFSIPVYVYNRI